VIIVDMGGGTLDVSVLFIQGSMFITVAMAGASGCAKLLSNFSALSGNNHLGGQDFNVRLLTFLLAKIEVEAGRNVTDQEDIQNLRLAIEAAKIDLTSTDATTLDVELHSLAPASPRFRFRYELHRQEFEAVCDDLFR